ncbi:MAG TPA: DUF11 domain-containing protein, partial [Thermoanaerobaculia bacterium]|nr:DUF11 domain-containing protein [Thermoanaerobaculia bacterium]
MLFAIASTPAFAQSADLGILKTGPNTATAGSDVTFVITATNAGPDDASGAVINDPIPAGMTFTSANQPSGPSFTCSNVLGTVSCNILTFPAGSTATFNFVFNIPNGTADGTFFFDTATINSDTPDPNPENNSSTWGTSTPLPPMADLSITKTGPTSAGSDTDVTYTIVVLNPSSNNATSVTWQDTLPIGFPGGAQMTFVSLTPSTGCTTGTTINCNIGTLAANSSITYTLVGHVPPGTGSGTTFTNTATVSASNDPDAENNASSTSLTVSSVDVSVTKTGPATVNAGAPLSYTIVVSNAGPDVAQNVNLSDALPAGTTFTSIVQNSGPAALCSGGGTVACNIPLLNPGASAQFTLTLAVGNVATVTNTATVRSDSFDTNAGNNSSTASTTVIAQADLSVTKTAPAAVLAGANLTYNLTLTNNGPSDATTV